MNGTAWSKVSDIVFQKERKIIIIINVKTDTVSKAVLIILSSFIGPEAGC